MISDPQKMVMASLLERLVNQMPAYQLDNDTQRTDDFSLKISTLYLELQKRTGIKPIFKTVLGIDHSKTYEDIDVIVERVAYYIMEYNAYCDIQEQDMKKRILGPRRQLANYIKKIDYKYRSLQKTYPEVHLAGLNMQSNPCGVSTATADISMFYDKSPTSKLSL
jgi:hypothetical protein